MASLELSGSLVDIDFIEGRTYSLLAMVDTGSPVSFVKYNTYRAIIKPFCSNVKMTDRKFVNLMNSTLEIIGSVKVILILRPLKDLEFPVELFVIKDQAFAADMILERRFLLDEKLTVIYKLHEATSDEIQNKIGLFAQLPLNASENPLRDIRQEIENCDIDFDCTVKKQLIEMLTGLEKQEIKKIDDYSVSVRLKDESIYAYAPRRFAHAERIEMREITDDLLKREIIQPSVSPYCARVVPVRKKMGN